MAGPGLRGLTGASKVLAVVWVVQKDSFSNAINQTMRQQYTPRRREQVERFFAGLDLADPGLVPVEEWRPEPAPDATRQSAICGAVGRKRSGNGTAPAV
jgi:hypothetical protein